jgi:hypothetical protein
VSDETKHAPARTKPADPFGGEWECGLPDRTDDGCPYPGHDCMGCAYLLVGGARDPNFPAGGAPVTRALYSVGTFVLGMAGGLLVALAIVAWGVLS